MVKKTNPFEGKEILGRAEIVAEFKIKDKRIAGCRVKEGKIVRGSKVMLWRQNSVVAEAIAASMRHHQEDIDEAKEGMEFGLVFSPSLDFRLGDVIISYNELVQDVKSERTDPNG